MRSIAFNRRLGDGSVYKLGTAVEYPNGWRFLPNVASHKPSRKYHSTWEKCLPRWVGYPDYCESSERFNTAEDLIRGISNS